MIIFRALILLVVLWGGILVNLSAQTTPLDKRSVSGILRDSLNKPIAGATVELLSPRDTMKTATNQFGFYGFKDVRSAEFLLSIRAVGYDAFNRKYFNNDTRAQLNIPPIRLGVKYEEIEEVTIERLKGPLVKGDTTEFWAKDYIVRDYARLEDLLRRMEGISIDPDGSVFYNGERVVRALFNNETYFTGSVQEAMKELPADIVERIQIIDRNESGTGAKTLKSEENTTKVMNIVTKEDKSAGRMYDITLEQGTQSRSKADASMRWIDGPDQTTVALGYKQLPEGIKADPIPGSIGAGGLGLGNIVMMGGGAPSNITEGQRKETRAALGRNIRFKSFRIGPQYNFNYTDLSHGTQTIGERFYAEGNVTERSDRQYRQYEQSHGLNGNYNVQSKKGGIIHGFVSADYKRYNNNTQADMDRNGIINSLERELTNKEGRSGGYRISLDYRKTIAPKWELSLMGSSSLSGDRGDEEIQTAVYTDGLIDGSPDSLIHQLRDVTNNQSNNSLNSMFTWTASDRLKVQYSLAARHRYNLRDIQAKLLEDAHFVEQDDLSNYEQSYQFAAPLSIRPEYSFANGMYFSPSLEVENSWLRGVLNPETASVERYDALWKPRLALGYTNSKIGNLRVGYNLSSTQPSISQLNPDVYYLTPYDIRVGDPNLKNSRHQGYDIRYSHFFRKSAFNVSLISNFSWIDRVVSSDRTIALDPELQIMKTMTHFRNVDGGKRNTHHITMTKTLKKVNSTLNYNAMITTNRMPYFLNGNQEVRNSVMQNHKFSFFYSPAKWLDITPELRYVAQEDENSVTTFAGKTYNRSLYGELKLGIYLPKEFRINANVSQAAFETTNIMSNTAPFVLNANIEKRIFKQKNGVISFVVMDLARQNAITNYSSDEFGYRNTLTNLDSRYFLLQFSWRPQVWGKSKHDSGMGRRGDGSFVK